MELIFGSADGSTAGAANPYGWAGGAGAAGSAAGSGMGTVTLRLADGSLAEVSGYGTAYARLIRLQCTNPLAYLSPDNCPGAAWPTSKGGTPVI